MSYVVEVPVNDADFTERLNRMRAWLDHRRLEPSGFRFAAAGDNPGGCRVYFRSETEARQFTEAFGGRLVCAPTTRAAIL
jgi:hypothetical protein